MQIPSYNYLGSFPASEFIEYPEPKDEIQKEILSAVTSMSNFISMESASRNIKRSVDLFKFYFLLELIFVLLCKQFKFMQSEVDRKTTKLCKTKNLISWKLNLVSMKLPET
jgi:hypothetical protein